MHDTGDVTVSTMVLRQLDKLAESVEEQGKVLSSMKTTQSYLARDLTTVGDNIERIAKNQIDCPARNGYRELQKQVDQLATKKPPRATETDSLLPKSKKSQRTTWGRIPLPSPQDIGRLLPWIIAIGAGAAAAMGWVDPGAVQ